MNQSSTLRNFLSLRQVNAGLKGGGATVFDFSGNAEINVSLEAKKILIDGVVLHPYRYHPLKLPNSFIRFFSVILPGKGNPLFLL